MMFVWALKRDFLLVGKTSEDEIFFAMLAGFRCLGLNNKV